MLINQYLAHVTYSTDLATDHAQGLLWRSALVGVGLFLLALLVFVVVTRMSNRLIRRLRRLRSETLELVGERLPSIVQRLERGEHVDLARDLPRWSTAATRSARSRTLSTRLSEPRWRRRPRRPRPAPEPPRCSSTLPTAARSWLIAS